MSLALYPGSFDPITYGHLNIIERGLDVFDEVLVAIARNVQKKALFTVDERLEMIRRTVRDKVAGHERVRIEAFEGLLAHYAREKGADVILRGLRAISDFEFEFQMAHMNRRLAPDVETIFMMTGEEQFYVSSQLVREVAAFGGDVSSLVPDVVGEALMRKFERT